jgi:short-subunit dehydrogenase
MDILEPLRPFALITGASAGMGAAFARTLAAQGYDVALVARRRDRLEVLAEELRAAHHGVALVIPADLSVVDAHTGVMAALEGRAVDLLINNAGYSIAPHFTATDWPMQRDSVITLVVAVIGLTHAVLPDMLARKRGRIITISSILALSQGGAGHTLYGPSKAFVHKFMLTLAAELAGSGVTVTSVLPGSTDSEFTVANGTAESMAKMPKAFLSTTQHVVDAALAGNAAGKLIVIPGWHNKLLGLIFKLAPDSLLRWASARATATFKGAA